MLKAIKWGTMFLFFLKFLQLLLYQPIRKIVSAFKYHL